MSQKFQLGPLTFKINWSFYRMAVWLGDPYKTKTLHVWQLRDESFPAAYRLAVEFAREQYAKWDSELEVAEVAA